MRAQTVVAKQQQYVLAARALGYSRLRVMLRHILPNTASAVIIFSMVDAVGNIILAASLGFLGLGAQPPTPEWGAMISDGQNYILSVLVAGHHPGPGGRVRRRRVQPDRRRPGRPAAGRVTGERATAQPLLTVRDLHSYLATGQGVVRAVDGVSFTVREAEILGIVGESGCGKTVTCRTIMGLMPRRQPARQRRGHLPPARRAEHPRTPRQSELQRAARRPPRDDLPGPDDRAEPGAARRRPDRSRRSARTPKLSRAAGPRAGHRAAASASASRPRRGGCATTRSSSAAACCSASLIAIALASAPRLLLADEPTTSLDVIIQDQILSLLLELQRDTGMSMILVSHDLGGDHRGLRPDRGDVRRPGRGGGRHGRHHHRAPAPLHQGAARRAAQRRGQRGAAAQHPRVAAEPDRRAERLPVRAPLPARDGRSAGPGTPS